MKGILGYGRYDDDSEFVGCPRAKSDMTPCVARDGDLAQADAGICVGCERTPATLLQELVKASESPSSCGDKTPCLARAGSRSSRWAPMCDACHRQAAAMLKDLVRAVTEPKAA